MGIFLYQTISIVNTWTVWASGLLTAGLIVRASMDFMQAYFKDELGLKEALQKVSKRIFAVVIAITATSLVALFKRYY